VEGEIVDQPGPVGVVSADRAAFRSREDQGVGGLGALCPLAVQTASFRFRMYNSVA